MTEVGTKFRKVGTDDIVTVVKVDEKRGTAVLKYPSGKCIPISTGSLKKADKWEGLKEDEQREPLMSKPQDEVFKELDDMILNVICKCKFIDEINYTTKKKSVLWILAHDSTPIITIKCIIKRKDKQLEIECTDFIAKLLEGTEFDNLVIDTKFVEDKLSNFLETVVEKLNEKESEEK